MFENHRKGRTQHCERSELFYILSGQELNKNEFLKLKACGQIVLPDRSLFIGQKMAKNKKIQMRHFGGIFIQCVLQHM